MTGRTLTWSYGGGTQSIAIAVLIAQGRLPKPEISIIADTGREATETWEYTERHVAPLLATVGVTIEIAPHSLSTVDLYGHNGDLLVPAFTAKGKLPTFCSDEWKRRPMRRMLRAKGIESCITWIGMSLDELGRMKPSDVQWQKYHWPLIFDVPLRRQACRQLILDMGLPEPPKSSCYICPHRRNSQWLRLKEQYPDDWEKALALDEQIRANDRTQDVYLHESRVPLIKADLSPRDTPTLPLFGDVDSCDSGYCMN